jgi:hypothetical protein
MTRRDWWLGVLLLTLAILAHALLPRYDWGPLSVTPYQVRVDRWFGTWSVKGPTK